MNRNTLTRNSWMAAAVFICWSWTCLVGAAEPKPSVPPAGLYGEWHADLAEGQSLVLQLQEKKVEMALRRGEDTAPLWSGELQFAAERSDQFMDWVRISAGDRRLPDNKCLYRLRGDTLLVVGGGEVRPSRFYSGPGAEPKVLVFTRVTVEARRGGKDEAARPR